MGFRDIFTLDVRSLALFRIGLGLILLYDLSVRLPDLEAHYTDAGVLSRSVRLDMDFSFGTAWWTSPHMLSGQTWFQGTLFGIQAGLAVLLVLGWRTQWVLFASWFLLLGLQARHPMVLQGCDVVLRCAMFWCLFLPIGAVWSLDAWRAKEPPPKKVLSLASAVLLGQLILIYYFTACLKTGDHWRVSGDALYYAIHIDHFTRPFGYWLAQYPHLLRPATIAAWLVEYIVPFMMLVPVANSYFRCFAIATMIGMHVGIHLVLDVGFFSAICTFYWLAFLPSGVWDRLKVRPLTFGAEFAPPLPRWQKLLVVVLFVGIFLMNQLRIGLIGYSQVFPDPIVAIFKTLGLDQTWNMFSPNVDTRGSWLVVEGAQADGTRVNLWKPDEPIPLTKPQYVSQMYDSVPWRRLMVTLYEGGGPTPHRRGMIEYFQRRWNATHPTGQRVISARVILYYQDTPAPDGQEHPPAPIQSLVVEEWTES